MRSTLLILIAWAAMVGPLAAQQPNRGNRPVINYTNFEPNIPIVFLEAKEAIVSERKVPCTVRLDLPKETASASTGALSGVVRIHGASSQMYAKKSFGLTLDAPVRWLGMRESAHWVLNAAFVDRSLMRHKLSYDLFRALSVSNAPRFAAASQFIEVNLNGKYNGVYLLMERVDRTLLELRRYDSNAPNHAIIYKAVDHAANFDHLGHGGFEQREPDPLMGEYWGPLDRFNRFVSRTTDAEFFDPAKGISARLDLGNAIDFHLLVLLTSNMDGIDKNLIIARDEPLTNAPVPRFFFAPWDYDATFGRNWNALPVEPTAWLSNHLFNRLLSDSTYRKRFLARWQQLRAREFSVQNIERMIDENARTLGDAVKRNETRWRTLDGPYPDRLSFEEDLNEMRQWIRARVQWLDQEISRKAASGRASVPARP